MWTIISWACVKSSDHFWLDLTLYAIWVLKCPSDLSALVEDMHLNVWFIVMQDVLWLLCISFPARAFPSKYDHDLYKLHLEAMFKGLLVHLDDPTSSIQVKLLLLIWLIRAVRQDYKVDATQPTWSIQD